MALVGERLVRHFPADMRALWNVIRRNEFGSRRHVETFVSRDVDSEAVPEGGGPEDFDTAGARAINLARLEHLSTLELPIDGRSVLEVGGGVGHLSGFFTSRNCKLVTTEARPANVEQMKRLYPGLDARVADVEGDLAALGRFDIVFCYGLLYHLENPLLALRNMAAVCDDLLLLETMITDSERPVLQLADETLSATQALRGLAHRPSPSYLALALDRIGFHNVYTPARPPRHPDYEFTPRGDMRFERDGHLLRQIFVASRRRLEGNDRLTALIEQP